MNNATIISARHAEPIAKILRHCNWTTLEEDWLDQVNELEDGNKQFRLIVVETGTTQIGSMITFIRSLQPNAKVIVIGHRSDQESRAATADGFMIVNEIDAELPALATKLIEAVS